MDKFNVLNLEVLGNDIDGFEVNDMHKVGTIELAQDIEDEQIVELLVEEGYLSGYAHGRCEVDQQESYIYINERESGKPLFQLQLINQ